MQKQLALLLIVGMLLAVLAACSAPTTSGPSQVITPSPTPCVTLTAAAANETSAQSANAAPAGHVSSPPGASGEPATVSPAEMATREAQLEHQNQPVPLPTGEQTNGLAVSMCPTPTPAK